jgi:hypothetical protein
MTGSNFAAKADAAAVALKQQLKLPSKQVAVDADGQPLKPLPPEGSYARMALDAQRAAQAQPPQANGEVPPQANGYAPTSEDELSANANRRFAEMTGQLRAYERTLAEAMASSKLRDDENARLRAELESVRAQQQELRDEHQRILDQTLDGLDSETRATVLMESKLKRLLDDHERKVTARLEQQLEGLREKSVHDDFDRLARKYARFDATLHRPAIEMFRGKNPATSIEQAFKAIAEPFELVLREDALATTVPPVLGPGPGPTADLAVPKPKEDPVDRMREDARLRNELKRSDDPEKRKIGDRLELQNLKERLGLA